MREGSMGRRNPEQLHLAPATAPNSGTALNGSGQWQCLTTAIEGFRTVYPWMLYRHIAFLCTDGPPTHRCRHMRTLFDPIGLLLPARTVANVCTALDAVTPQRFAQAARCR